MPALKQHLSTNHTAILKRHLKARCLCATFLASLSIIIIGVSGAGYQAGLRPSAVLIMSIGFLGVAFLGNILTA